MSLPIADNYREILTAPAALLDVRAPCEFSRGHLPGAVNAPLLVDEERHLVGLRYKEQGQEAAIALGEQLVCGDRKADRIRSWKILAQSKPRPMLYCFRGGLRSRIAQQWLYAETGRRVPRIAGGYKAMRAFVSEHTRQLCERQRFLLLGGRTGVGKTSLLTQIDHHVDLEGLANHRGSAFGGLPDGQPAPASFEMALGIALMRQARDDGGVIVLEHEGRTIGSLSLPPVLHDAMQRSSIVLLTASFEQRVEQIKVDYVDDLLAACIRHAEQDATTDGHSGFAAFSLRLTDAAARIRKRLGNSRHEACRAMMAQALARQRLDGDTGLHRQWIAYLLREYYDPMYDYQLQRNRERIVFEGNHHAVKQWLEN